MRKYDFISALAQEAATEVVKNRDEWMKYLTTAARLYKYPFNEQMLIYAQRPDATVCASLETWNEKMNCWVNRGAKGIEKLNDTSRKDNVVTFEQLSVDRLFVDESHNYKNLFLYTKMRNVAGIAQSEAQKSSDMFAKCQYLDELTGGKGVTFATGTPISNSMTELYTNMRYLQYGTLQKLGLGHFDSWASSFGETQTAIEFAQVL